MAYNFVAADREQLMLMPPSVADWLPEDHLAWFVLDVVAELDLSGFYAGYRVDGRGGAAYDPSVMLAVLVYAYCTGERSSRRIERRLAEDVAFRVVGANQQPDHATIARFRASHETAIGSLFGQVLAVCARQGLLRPGLVAIDGTRMVANASKEANRTAEQVAERILAEAAAVDAGEDAEESRRDEQPGGPDDGGVGPRAGRRARLRRVLDELQAEAAEHSYEAVMARRAAQEAETGKKIRGKRPSPNRQKNRGRQHGNITDPDSRLMNTKDGFVQGYNAQAVATMDQFVIAAEVSNQPFDAPLYEGVIGTAKTNLKHAGEKRRLRRVVADAGYWSEHNTVLSGVESFIAPGRARKLRKIAETEQHRREVIDQVQAGELTKPEAADKLGVSVPRINQILRRRRAGEADQLTAASIAKIDSLRGRRTYARRAGAIEPVFAQIKHNRKIRNISRRGLAAADSEWKLICATHNLLKLYRLT
jgi:transposase/DNA-directed RNA polymerase specialized sigma24 family protein